MGTQKPEGWANLVLTRFDKQVRDWRCEKHRSPCLRFLVISFRARPLLLPSRFVSLSPPSSGVCGHLLLPLMSHSRCIYGTRPFARRLLVNAPFMGASWDHTGTVGLVPTVLAPRSLGYRISSSLVTRDARGDRFFSSKYFGFWYNDCEDEDASDSRLHSVG